MTGLAQFTGALTAALKEWHVAVQAIADGKTIVLLRKGGIREANGQFQVQNNRVLLFPTYEHQKAHWLKSDYADALQEVESGWHPPVIDISVWAEISDVIEVNDRESLENVFPFHIWNERFASERFHWKPRQPLYLLLLRAYTLPHPVKIPYIAAYGGCRSWIKLSDAIALEDSKMVLSASTYSTQVAAIRAAASSPRQNVS